MEFIDDEFIQSGWASYPRATSKLQQIKSLPSRALDKVKGLRRQQPLRFFDLPGEVRNLVYKHALVLDQIHVNPTRWEKYSKLPRTGESVMLQKHYRKNLAMNLLLANRQAYYEGRHFLYRGNAFVHVSTGSWLVLEQWLEQIGEANAASLQTIRLCLPSRRLSGTPLEIAKRQSLLSLFLHDFLNPSSEQIRNAIEKSDYVAFQRVCHRLAQLNTLHAARIWTFTMPIQYGGGYSRPAIIRAPHYWPVQLGQLRLIGRTANTEINSGEDGAGRFDWFAIQLERYVPRVLPSGRSYYRGDIVHYEIPGVISLSRP